ncbi:hypothetical protein [Schumannella soli]|uniref:hypothetical protein n=1 Tax=Schumannella soli TaxID=2590779 RepID=UPI0015E85EE4|nr:hypothetical protein [Schumannella soli]
MRSKTSLIKGGLGIIAVSALAFSLAACSTSNNSGSSPSKETTKSSETKPEPVVSLPDLSKGVDTEVTVDQGFVDALTSLKLTPGVVGTAKFENGIFSFPITGGNVDYYDPAKSYRPYVQGEIDHNGSGISLTGGGKVVELTDFVIDPGTSELHGKVTVDGQVAADDAFLFDLHGGTLKPLRTEGNNGILEGTTVHISADAADLLNKTFGTDAVKPQLLVGVAKITVATK